MHWDVCGWGGKSLKLRHVWLFWVGHWVVCWGGRVLSLTGADSEACMAVLSGMHWNVCVCVGGGLKFEWTETCMSVLSGGMHWVVCVGRKRSHITSHLWQSGHSHISSHSSSPANTLTQPSPKNSTEFDNIMLYWPQCKFSPQLEHQTAHFVCTLKQPRCTC